MTVTPFRGEGGGAVILHTDITERKRAELALRESEERFRRMADAAPVLVWMSGPDKGCMYFNKGWLDFRGRTPEEEMGDGWVEGVHPEDRDQCLSTYVAAFDVREPFTMVYRLRRHDGEHRWILDTGVPRFDAEGGFAGYIGSCVDITEQEQAREALRELSGHLIRAQEQERSRIARELHDDFNQRLACRRGARDAAGGGDPGSSGRAARPVGSRKGALLGRAPASASSIPPRSTSSASFRLFGACARDLRPEGLEVVPRGSRR
jgi:PAS domain S-box-containing protein